MWTTQWKDTGQQRSGNQQSVIAPAPPAKYNHCSVSFKYDFQRGESDALRLTDGHKLLEGKVSETPNKRQ